MFKSNIEFMTAIWNNLEKVSDVELLQDKKDALEICADLEDPLVHWDQKVDTYLELAVIEMQLNKRKLAKMCNYLVIGTYGDEDCQFEFNPDYDHDFLDNPDFTASLDERFNHDKSGLYFRGTEQEYHEVIENAIAEFDKFNNQ